MSSTDFEQEFTEDSTEHQENFAEEEVEYPDGGFYYIIKNGRKAYFFKEEKITLSLIPKNKVKTLINFTEQYNRAQEKINIIYPPGYCKIKINGRFKYFLDGVKIAYSKIKDKKSIVDITEENLEKIQKTKKVDKYGKQKNLFNNYTQEQYEEYMRREKTIHEENLEKIMKENLSDLEKDKKIDIEKDIYIIHIARLESIWKLIFGRKEEQKKRHQEREKFEEEARKARDAEYARRAEQQREEKRKREEQERAYRQSSSSSSNFQDDEVKRRPFTYAQISDGKLLLDRLNIKTKQDWKKWLIRNHPDRNPDNTSDFVGRVNTAAEIQFQRK